MNGWLALGIAALILGSLIDYAQKDQREDFALSKIRSCENRGGVALRVDGVVYCLKRELFVE